MTFETDKQHLAWYAYASILIFSVILCVLIIVYYYRSQITAFYNRADASSISEISLHESMFKKDLLQVASDTRLLADNHVMLRYADHPSPEMEADVESFWKRMLTERETYDQIRLLDLSGMEVLRVDYNNKFPISIPKSELQDKSERYYVTDVQSLRMGRVYVSPMDVNQENGVPEQPLKPTIRFASGVYNSLQKRVGILVINYNASNYLSMLRASSHDEKADFMILNHDSYWLMHPDQQYEWGQYIPGSADTKFGTMFPQAWEQIQRQKRGKLLIKDNVYDFDTFDLQNLADYVSTRRLIVNDKDKSSNDSQIKYVAHLPSHVIGAYRKKLMMQCAFVLLIWTVLSLLPCWGLSNLLVNYFHEHTELSHRAHHDNVTGLANRVLFTERLEHALMMSERYERICAVLYVDLDGFKPVNDEYGHHIGDELLVSVAGRMHSCIRKTDTVARIGGDEFAILLAEIANRNDAIRIGEKVISRLFDPIPTSKGPVSVGASLGVAVYPEDGHGPEALLEHADKQMYENKRSHKKLNISRDAS
ncbi:MAG: hypothetical protein CMJ19_01600 [Phycisphaeraceae bacterium]|nr:hypothetical protein [Phycisphaeraceae bacterium]